jgi:hypothetical protein
MAIKLRILGTILFVAATATISTPLVSAQEVQTSEPTMPVVQSDIWDQVHRVFNSVWECEDHRRKNFFIGACVPGPNSTWLYVGSSIFD